LGARRRLLAASVVALGLVTFFIPFITSEPPAKGMSNWSLWNIACAIQNGSLPGSPNHNFVAIMGLIYAVLLVDLIGLCFSVVFSVPKIQITVALIGAWLCCVARYSHLGQTNWKLDRLFYGETSCGHVSLGQILTGLIVIMTALCLFSLDAMLDTDAPARPFDHQS